MIVRLLSPRTGFVMVAALFLILAPETGRAQPTTHSGVFKIDASRAIVIWENRGLSVGTQNVLITVCVTTGLGVNVTVDGGDRKSTRLNSTSLWGRRKFSPV